MKYLKIYKDRWGRRKVVEQVEVSRSLRDRVLVVDTNLAIDHAMRFVEDGLEVYYYLANLSAFPKLEDTIAGDGLHERLVKVEDWGEVFDKVGLIYVTDNCFPDLVVKLREKGKLVYGPSPELVKWENDRAYAYEEMRKRGIGVPEGAVVRGKDELVRWIKEREGSGKRFFVKVSKLRGNVETFSVVSAEEAETMLAQGGFGPYLQDLVFLVQEGVEGVEIGVDAFVVPDGVCRPLAYTIEEKGRGNVAVWQRSSDFEEFWYDKVMDVVRSDDYRCNLSIEGIWTGGDLKVIDVTSRNPYPVSSLYPRFVKNWVDVIFGVAEGRVVELDVDWENPYMVEFTISTDVADVWRVIEVPDELVNWKGEGVGFRRVVKKDGMYWFVPGDGLVATVNTKGKTLEKAIEKAKEMVERVKCMYSLYDGTFFESVEEKIEKLNVGHRFRFEVVKREEGVEGIMNEKRDGMKFRIDCKYVCK